MEVTALLYDLNTSYGLDLREAPTVDSLETILAERIGILINTDFSALVQLLYRVDVSETRLRQLLQENRMTDAGRLIARLMLERQWQKIETRREFSRERTKGDAADEERW
jgi:hypothetical protein